MSEQSANNRMMLSFWDGGRCHVTRMMTIAEEAQQHGIEVGFITSEKYAQEVGAIALDNVYVIPNRPPNPPPAPYPFPLYSHAFRHAQRLRGLQFDNVDWLRQTTQAEIDAIRDFKPGVIVNDYRDTIRTAAEVCGVPVAAITHTTGNVDGFTLGWWVAPPEDAHIPDCRDSFNQVRAEFGLSPIVDEREMFSGTINCIPSIEEIDPLRQKSPNSFYVGMISRGPKPDPSFKTISPEKAAKRIFSYVGEPTRPQYGYEEMLRRVIESDEEHGYYVVGPRDRYESAEITARERKGNLVIGSYLPGATVIEDSEVVMCHGGNGTVMLSLSMGKPLICVGPYQSDCTSIFRQVENQGAGILLNHSTGPLEQRSAPDLGNDISIFGYWDTSLDADTLSTAISRVTSEPAYRENARRLGDKLLSLGGARRVVELCIEKFMAA